MAQNSKLVGIDAMMLSEDDSEKTFKYDADLVSLPVPDLDQTLRKYLDSVKPHVSDKEFQEVEVLCQQFAKGEGKVLHEKLLARAQTSRNWLEEWWEGVAYMELRLPTPLMNMAGIGPYVYDIWKFKNGTLISRAALMLYFIVEFWQLVRKERIKPHQDGKGIPLCMNQFRKLFSTCRIPGAQKDSLVHYFKTESEGPAPTHIVVMCKGHIFRLEVLDDEGRTLTAPELQSQLQRIYDQAGSLPPAQSVSFFTSLERTQWAHVRSRLTAAHPDNFHSLQVIEQSMISLGLDDYCPVDVDEMARCGMMGDPSNKWFDKSISFIGFGNGVVTLNCDHSPMDGMMLVFNTFYVHNKILECGGEWQGPTGVRKLPEVKLLQFHLDDSLLAALEDAKKQYTILSARVEMKVSGFQNYGKDYLKSISVHPDTCVQLALQLAYYRKHGSYAPTYETATTRKFYHGRTETVRSCSVEACQWCVAMGSNTIPESEKQRLFRVAVEKHNKLMEEATNLEGCDRHLFGLGMIAREEGLPFPQLFQHEAFSKSGGGGNYILSTSCIGYTTVFGGVAPMCPHGYGVFYCICDDRVMFFISTWTQDEDTSSKMFTDEVHRALDDIKLLVDGAKLSTARL